MDFRIKVPFAVPGLGRSNFRTTKIMAVGNIVLILFFIYSFATFLNVKTNWGIEGLAIGFAFGLICGVWLAPRLLKRTENHKDILGWKEYLGITVPALLIYLFGLRIDFFFSEFFLISWLISYSFVEMSLFLFYERKKKIYITQKGLLSVEYSLVPQTIANGSIQIENEKTAVNKKISLSSRFGYTGGFLFLMFSIIQLVNNQSEYYWWSGSVISGAIIIISGVVDFSVGIVGSYGAYLGKKLGGNIMLASGILGLICTPIYGIVFGCLLIVGGTIAILKRSIT